MDTSLAVVKEFAPPALYGMGSGMAEEMDGLTMTFDRVKIPAGGALAFEVPGEDPDSPDTVKELIGVMAYHHPMNVYWPDSFTGQGNPPQCSSMDGKTGIGKDGKRQACIECPLLAWGSGEGGVGRACKQIHRVYLLRSGAQFPLLLTIPRSSLSNFASYIGKRVLASGKRGYEVVTKITLKKAVSSGGITYSQAVFTLVGALTPEAAKGMAAYSAGLKEMTRRDWSEDNNDGEDSSEVM